MAGILSLPEELLEDILSYAAFDCHEDCCCERHYDRVCYTQYRGIVQTCKKFRRIGGNIYWKQFNV